MDRLTEEIAKELTVDMIPDGIWKAVAGEIGVENLIRLAELVGGADIYVPKPDSFTRPALYEKIKKEYTGYNQTALARRYGVTERWIRQICGSEPIEGQLDFASVFERGFP